MNTKIIQWKDTEDLSKGFVIDLENSSAAEAFTGIYKHPEQLIEGFADMFLLMGFSPQDSEEMAINLNHKARDAMENMIDKYRSIPVPKKNLFPANAMH
jgi:hypothetical protein